MNGTPKGRLFPLSRDELVECAALLESVRRGELDRLAIPSQPLDVLAQQIVAEVATSEYRADELYALVRRAWAYRDLPRQDFDAVVEMLSNGFSTRRGRRGALIHYDRVNGMLRGRRGARLTSLTSGGTIPDNADYQVLVEPENQLIGTVNEDFAVETRLAETDIEPFEKAFRDPLQRDAKAVAKALGPHGEPVLLGSIATGKYVDVLVPAFSQQLLFPAEFVGRGDMSRGGLLLRAVDARQELTHVPVRGTIVRGARPSKLPPRSA